MQILAFDTATAACSVALWRDGAVRGRRFEPMQRGQAEALMPMVNDVLAIAEAAYEELDLIAVTVGPGAFTGLRIGLAAARGLALATGAPCLGVTTLEAVAHGVAAADRSRNTLLVALDAKRADLYAQAFDGDVVPLTEAVALMPDELPALLPPGPVVVVGDAAEPAIAALADTEREVIRGVSPGVPDAATVAALAAARWRPDMKDLAPPAPLYLRPPDAVVPLDGGRRRPAPSG
jgi:tRNA threonylcarbamoyladenosine biosynthesis protein TsaB